MKEFKEILLGNANSAEFAASMFFAILAAVALILFRVKKRDPASERTPEHWSWSFFWSDNLKQQIGTFILIFICVRISQYWTDPSWLVPVALVIGLISDQLAMLALRLKDRVTEYFKKRIDNVDQAIEKTSKKVDKLQDSVDELTDKTDKL